MIDQTKLIDPELLRYLFEESKMKQKLLSQDGISDEEEILPEQIKIKDYVIDIEDIKLNIHLQTRPVEITKLNMDE